MANMYRTPSAIILTCAAFVLITLNEAGASHGTDFVFTLPQIDVSGAILNIYISPHNSSSEVLLKWTPPSTPNPNDQAVISKGKYHLIAYKLNTTLLTVHMWSDDPVVVIASVVVAQKSVLSIGTFLVMPTLQLSSRYITVTHCGQGNCFFVITSPNNNVTVTINFKLIPSNATFTFRNVSCYNGKILDLPLQASEAVQVDSGSVDLTGSVINSNYPVHVAAGGSLPLSTSTKTTQNYTSTGVAMNDVIIEQMPTDDLFGTEFALVAFPLDNETTTTVKVTYTQQKTSLHFSSSELYVKSNNSNWTSFGFVGSLASFLSSDRPIIVELIHEAKNGSNTNSAAGVIVIPVHKWAPRYVTFMQVGSITLVTTDECTSQIDMNATLVSPFGWMSLNKDGKYSYVTLPFVARNVGSVLLEGKVNCTFGGYVMYQIGSQSTAFPMGWRGARIENNVATSSTADDDMTQSASALDMSSATEVMKADEPSAGSGELSKYPQQTTGYEISSVEPRDDQGKTTASVSDSGVPAYLNLSTPTITQMPINFPPITNVSFQQRPSCVQTSLCTVKTDFNVSGGNVANQSHVNGSHLYSSMPIQENSISVMTQELMASLTVVSEPQNTKTVPGGSTSSCIRDQSMSSIETVSEYIPQTESALSVCPSGLADSTSTDIICTGNCSSDITTSTTPSSNHTATNGTSNKKTTKSHINISMKTNITNGAETTVPTNVGTTTGNVSDNPPTFTSTTSVISTDPRQCPCSCKFKYLNMKTNSTRFLSTLKRLETDLSLDKKTLISHRSTKSSLDNKKLTSKYIGGTFSLTIILLIFGFLFTLDMINIARFLFCRLNGSHGISRPQKLNVAPMPNVTARNSNIRVMGKGPNVEQKTASFLHSKGTEHSIV